MYFYEFKNSKKKYFGIFEGKLFCQECGRKFLYREDYQKTKNGISTYRKYYCEFCKANQKSNIVKDKQKLLLKKQKLEQELEKESSVMAIKKVSNSADVREVTKGLVDNMPEKVMVSRYGGVEIELK